MMYKSEELVKQTTKELLAIAKEVNITGRHNMRKEQLIEALVSRYASIKAIEADGGPSNYSGITSASVVKSTRQYKDIEADLVLNNHTEEWGPASTVSFDCNAIQLQKPKEAYIDNAKVGTVIAFKVNDAKVISGMVEEIHRSGFLVKTKNGVRFTVRKKNIIWVKTGPRWPRGVYLALKGEAPNVEYKAAN